MGLADDTLQPCNGGIRGLQPVHRRLRTRIDDHEPSPGRQLQPLAHLLTYCIERLPHVRNLAQQMHEMEDFYLVTSRNMLLSVAV